MFTGIIRLRGILEELSQEESGVRRMRVRLGEQGADPPGRGVLGSSVAVHGACLTLRRWDSKQRTLEFDLSSETMRCTTFALWTPGSVLHLESSLCMGDPVDGHWVFGHVDGVAVVNSVEEIGETRCISFEFPGIWADYLAPKGSIALDGVSLTINSVTRSGPSVTTPRGSVLASVMIIPETLQRTEFATYGVGRRVHFEVDPVARYLVPLARGGGSSYTACVGEVRDGS